jgi:hypothetical protein
MGTWRVKLLLELIELQVIVRNRIHPRALERFTGRAGAAPSVAARFVQNSAGGASTAWTGYVVAVIFAILEKSGRCGAALTMVELAALIAREWMSYIAAF